jgi:hypothetical protein
MVLVVGPVQEQGSGPARLDPWRIEAIEWDGWGWGGQDFSVFLVFDPADSLSGPAKSRQ